MADILTLIDKKMGILAQKLPSLVLEIVKRIVGDNKNIYKLELTDPKLASSKFDDIKTLLLETTNNLNDVLLNEIEKWFIKEFGKKYDSAKAKGEFLDEIKTTTKVFMQGMTDTIRKDVLESIALTMTSTSVKTEAEALSKRISKSVKQTIAIIQESTVRKVREKNLEILLKGMNDDDLLLFSHVIDSKNSEFCSKYGNKAYTKEEWLKIKSDVLEVGGHIGCRGVFVVISKDEYEKMK